MRVHARKAPSKHLPTIVSSLAQCKPQRANAHRSQPSYFYCQPRPAQESNLDRTRFELVLIIAQDRLARLGSGLGRTRTFDVSYVTDLQSALVAAGATNPLGSLCFTAKQHIPHIWPDYLLPPQSKGLRCPTEYQVATLTVASVKSAFVTGQADNLLSALFLWCGFAPRIALFSTVNCTVAPYGS